MAMNLGPGGGQEPEVMVDINTTPLIDVMLCCSSCSSSPFPSRRTP